MKAELLGLESAGNIRFLELEQRPKGERSKAKVDGDGPKPPVTTLQDTSPLHHVRDRSGNFSRRFTRDAKSIEEHKKELVHISSKADIKRKPKDLTRRSKTPPAKNKSPAIPRNEREPERGNTSLFWIETRKKREKGQSDRKVAASVEAGTPPLRTRGDFFQ